MKIIVFVSSNDAFAEYNCRLAGYESLSLSTARRFMATLIDKRAALLFIDGHHPDWQALTLTSKSNAATRRIPICLISNAAAIRARAIASGADLALSWVELDQQFARILRDFARVPAPATLRELHCACQGALPARAIEGIQQFNRGEYYRQHDLFEAEWVETPGPVRDLYRAILQVGVAYYQIERGNFRGALKMLQRSVQWLYLLPNTCQGVDVAGLRRDSYAVRAELQRLGPAGLADFDRRLLKPVRWQPPQASSADPST